MLTTSKVVFDPFSDDFFHSPYATYRRLRLSDFCYVVVFLHTLVLLYGAYYTYAETPLGNWAKETGVNYAPPSFIGADIEGGAPAAPVTPPGSAAPAVEFKSETGLVSAKNICRIHATVWPSSGLSCLRCFGEN